MSEDQKYFIAMVIIFAAGAVVWWIMDTCFSKQLPVERISTPKDQPTASDPLATMGVGQMFTESMRQMVQQAVRYELRGVTSDKFDGVPEAFIAMELIARGWVAYKPSEDLKKV